MKSIIFFIKIKWFKIYKFLTNFNYIKLSFLFFMVKPNMRKKKFRVYYTLPPNLYCVLHIASLSSKSSNAPFICIFWETTLFFFLDRKACSSSFDRWLEFSQNFGEHDYTSYGDWNQTKNFYQKNNNIIKKITSTNSNSLSYSKFIKKKNNILIFSSIEYSAKTHKNNNNQTNIT